MHDPLLAMPRLFQRFLVLRCASSRPHPHLQMKALENDIHATLTMLRRHINHLESPLYRLPPDLFPEVASHFASGMDLVNATHMSHHLRNILLSCPSLWSHLNFEHEAMAWAFFKRSGRTLLHINMSNAGINCPKDLGEESKRIATLQLPHWLAQKEYLPESLPSLRRLEIFFDGELGGVEEGVTLCALVWRPTLKEATLWSFPSLTTLIVHRVSLTSFYAPNLTRFKFRDCKSFFDFPTQMDLSISSAVVLSWSISISPAIANLGSSPIWSSRSQVFATTPKPILVKRLPSQSSTPSPSPPSVRSP